MRQSFVLIDHLLHIGYYSNVCHCTIGTEAIPYYFSFSKFACHYFHSVWCKLRTSDWIAILKAVPVNICSTFWGQCMYRIWVSYLCTWVFSCLNKFNWSQQLPNQVSHSPVNKITRRDLHLPLHALGRNWSEKFVHFKWW